jgi:hypothetical protein
METWKKWSLEERKEFKLNVAKWRSELIKYKDLNVFYHPNKPAKPYRRSFYDGKVKMVPWNIGLTHGEPSFQVKNREGESIRVFIEDLIEHFEQSYSRPPWE